MFVFGANKEFNFKRYDQHIYLRSNKIYRALIFFKRTCWSYVFYFIKCHVHRCFVLIEMLGICKNIWFEDVKDFTISSYISLWYFIVMLTEYEIGKICMPRSFKQCLFSRIFLFFRLNHLGDLCSHLHNPEYVLNLLLSHNSNFVSDFSSFWPLTDSAISKYKI